jgi:transcriptional regulator with XRE-family HTH domain
MVYLSADGERVRELRKEQGLSQREFAARAHVSRRTLQTIEAGKVHPQPETVRKIARALGVDPRILATVAKSE